MTVTLHRVRLDALLVRLAAFDEADWPYPAWTPERIAQFRRLFDQGLTYREIGERINRTPATLCVLRRKFGFPIRQRAA